MKKTIVDESLFAIRTLVVVLCVICGAVPAWAGHDTHYARVTVTAPPTGQGKVYMTTDGDYVPEDGDWQNSMSATWNCNDGVDDEADSRTYYVHAQATSGNHFVKWSSNSSGSDSKSTATKYAYSTSAQSESSGSPTANNIYAIFEANPVYTGTFLLSENGTFKYQYGESAEVTVTSEHPVTTDQNFTFTALPDAGYTVYGWYTKSGGTKTYFDYSSTTIASYALPGNISIGVDFVPVGTPIFRIKGTNQYYSDLNAAITACGSATKTIVLINNGTLPAGNYTIPVNITLLIPFDEGFTCYTTTPALTTNAFLTPEVYRMLTMAPGANLTVNGAISVSAKLSSRSGYGPNGATSGKYGAIKMLSEGNTKSKITLNSGAKLYGWGYIYGEGAVEALSGSTVYEGFVIMDWRGGSNTLDMYDNRNTYKIFPFNQYYIQNIEVPLTLHKGATETVYSSVYGNGSDNPLSITMVGESNGLFRLTGTGAKLTKWYDSLYDRQHYELEGAAAINAISFTAFGMTVSSSAFVLPITNNMDITVRNGATVSIAEDVCIMPDASVTVEQGATVNIAKNVYVYDKQAYTNANTYTTSRGGYPSAGPGRYAAGAYVRHIAYSPSWAALSNREIRRLQNMSSAHFQVNGTLNVNGKLYTTEGGADIFSTADGAAVNLVTAAGTANKTYQVDHENYDAYYYTIPITSAKLHNADGSYQATAGNAENTTWTYAHGHWGWCIIWRLEDGTELKRMYQPAQPNATWISSNAPETSKPDEGTCSFVFNDWNTVTNTSQQEIILTADYTKTCTEYYDVLWKSEDGTETYETDEHVGQGETTRYNGAAPSKADDKTNGFTYTFDGWTTEPNGGGTKYTIGETPAATGDITYYAHFAATEVAAIITANGVVSYYPSIADAFTAANASDYTPTIQVWRDAPNTPALTYTAKNHCTLDLNGHTVSGTEMPLLTINDEGFTFTVTDRTETKEGRLAGTSGVSQAFVVSLVSGVFRLEAGTVYGQNIGAGVMAGVYAGANREVIMTGGTIQVDANSGTGYGIFAQGKGTINGGTIRVESSAKSAYAVQAQGSNGNVTITDGKFYAAGSSSTVTCVLAKGGASLTVNGGYYNINTDLTTYLGAGCHVINLPASELPYQYKVGTGGYTVTFQNEDGTVLQSGLWENGATPIFTGATPTKPGDTGGEYIHSSWTPDLAPVAGDATYTATYVPAPPVASVTINGTTTEYIHFSDAWTAANSATDASTLTLLQDVTVTSQLTYNNSNNKNCILDLNGHTLTSNTSQQSPLHINNTNVTFTITDGTENKSGKLSLNTSSSSTIFGVYVQYGTFLLNGGTLEVTSSTSTVCGVTIHYGTFTMNGGTIHVKTTNGKEGRGIYANSTTTVNGGTVHVDAAGTAYGIRHDAGIMTINNGKFSISGSTANVTTQTSATANMVIRGGYYTTKSQIYPTAPYYVFDLTFGAEFDEGYRYKVAEAYTLSWSTDGELSGERYTPAGLTAVGTPIEAPTSTKEGYVFAGWTPAVADAMPSADTEYTAQWAVASVTIGETTTLYTTFADAWSAVNNASAASTLKLLDNVDLTTGLEYTNASKNCTLDLNGHIISGSATPLLKIAQNGITFTITDLTEAKEGRIECNTHINGQKWAVEVSQSTLRFEGGTIYAKNTQAGQLFIGIYSGASGVIEISGGNIHTVTTAANPAYGVLTFGTATISGGSFKVESGAAGYAVEAYGDNTNILITGGNFYATGSSAACVHRSKGTLTLRGGYYNTNTSLATYTSAPFYVFPNQDATYLYKVAEGYTVTFNTNGHGSAPEAQLIEKNAHASEPTAPTATGYTFGGWYKEAGCETPWNFASDVVTAATTLFAKWTRDTYTISYELNGGSVASENPTSYTVESSAITLNNPTKANYVFVGWTGTDLASATMNVTISAGFTGDRSYTATWTPAVASVTISGNTEYYADFNTAWTAASGAGSAAKLTLLDNVTGLSAKTYNAAHDLTLDLNGHTLSGAGTITSLFLISCTGFTFTVTDSSANHDGKLSFTAESTSTSHCVIVNNGTFVLEAGMMEATSSTASIGAVQVAGGTFTMKENGAVHAKYTGNVAGKNSRIVNATGGTTNINGGTIHLESTSDVIGVVYNSGTVTITGGNFKIEAGGTAAVTNKTEAINSLNIRGGYYSANTTDYFEPHVKTPYHIFSNSDATYIYKVAESYTVTFKNEDETLQSDLLETGSMPAYTGVTPVKAADAQYTYTFNGWSPAVSAVTANVIYTAQFSSTVNTYTMTWKNADGTTLETDENVPYGNTPVYNGATPTKAKDAEYAYAFSGWSPAVSAVTGDATYTATYTTTPVVASVTANATGYTLYYTDFSTAFTEAKDATLAVTITLLRDASSAALQYSGANTDCTLDLNGHTLTSTATQLMVNVNKAGSTFTITDKSESKSGQMRIEATNTSEAYGVYVSHGHLKLEAGTIYASLVATTGAGVRAVNANSSFTMDGGTIHVVTTNAKNGIGVTASNGTTTINDGTILVEAAKDGYGINRTGGKVTVDGGKFNISATGSAYATNQASANASVLIRGGYYTTNSQLYPTTPHHVFGLDNQSPYLYEVAEGYTLTWTTDGDPLTGTYTSGVTKVGTTIVEPATPTKTGYTFYAWSPAVAETMLAENTEYTATWTPNTNTAYAVKHYQQNIADDDYTLIDTENLTGTTDATTEAVAKSYTGFTAQSFSQSTIAADGLTTVSIYYNRDKFTITWNNADGTTLKTDANVKYGALPAYDGATPTKATDAEHAYTFETWSPAVSAVTGDVTYTATYTTTPVVASVTVNEATAYYTSFADAWTVANSGSEDATLTLLQDVTVTTPLAYTNSNNQNCTLNLNGHILTSNTSEKSPLHINNTNVTFTVTDGTEEKTGKLSLNTSSSSTIFGAYAENGHLLLNGGTIEVISGTATTCGVTVYHGTFTMNGGTIHVKTTNDKEGRGIYAYSTTTVNGGTVHVEAAGEGYGIKRDNGTVTVNNGKFNVTGSPAYVTNQASTNANVVIKGGYYNIDTQLGTCVTSPCRVHTLPDWHEAFDAGYRYEVIQGAASVTTNGATNYYNTFDLAFTAANASTTYEPTITLLQDAVTTTTSMLSYTGAKNCTLNLNGHTLSSTTAQALLYINHADITFTITDLTESQLGTLHLESTSTDNRWCVYVAKGNLQMDAGTVFLRSKANTYNEGIRIDPSASTFTMNGGKVHVETSDGKPARGIVSRGIAVINDGEIQVEASGVGYGIEARVSDDGKNIGNVTVNGGKFLVSGTTAACAYRSDTKATLKLQGGYYSSDTNLATYCAADYAVLPTEDTTYPFMVAKSVTDITVNANKTVTIDGNTTTNTTTVHVSGTLEVAENVTLTTNDLILEATPSSSGEIIGNVAATNAYFDLSQPGGFKARTWYAVAVPWQVEVPEYALGDVSLSNDGENYTQQTLGSTFDLIYYNGALRATGASKAWKYVEDDPASKQVMVPGRAYMIYLTTDANVIRFRKSANAALHTNTLAVYEYYSDEPKDASWNGIANPATYYAYINANVKDYKTGELNVGQVYNAESKTYSVVDMNAKNMVVGQPVFVQATATNESVVVYADHDDAFHAAPRRTNAQETSMTRYEVMFAQNEGDVTDRIIVRLNEEKEENTYVVGQDLVKMGVSDMVPQMWVDRYDSKMCINTVAPVNNKADYPLGISVQQSGAYDLFIDDQPDDETMLYLTYDGAAIWNLSYGGYVVNLEKGTNSHYGLRIVYAPQTATGIENVQRDNVQCTKVLMDDHVFIIRGGNIYTMDGQLVK